MEFLGSMVRIFPLISLTSRDQAQLCSCAEAPLGEDSADTSNASPTNRVSHVPRKQVPLPTDSRFSVSKSLFNRFPSPFGCRIPRPKTQFPATFWGVAISPVLGCQGVS